MKKKKLLIITLCVVLALALLAGGAFLLAKLLKKPVPVYAVSDFAMDSYWGDSGQTDGSVRYDRMQAVYLSDTQIVTGVLVTEGQKVKAGTPLITFDTTLTDIEVERAALAVSKLEIELREAKEYMAELNAMKPYVPPAPTPVPTPDPTPTPPPLEPIPAENLPFFVEGTRGEMGNPFRFIIDREVATPYTTAVLEMILQMRIDLWNAEHPEPEEPLPEPVEEPEEPPTECFVIFERREENALNGDLLEAWAMRLFYNAEGNLSFELVDPASLYSEEEEEEEPTPEEEPELPVVEEGGYSAQELAAMRLEQKGKIRDLDLELRMARVKLEEMRRERATGEIVAEVDGVIAALTDEDTARQENEPLILLSGGGGYLIDISVSEFDLETVGVGDPVTIQSWESGGEFEGVIESISEIPLRDGGYYGGGNSNASRYGAVVRLDDESAALKEYEWVTVTLTGQAAGAGNTLYLENAFLVSESGKRFVWVRNEEERLEKRPVSCGMNLWGSYTRILSGLSMEDYVAFPYGRDLTEGAKCVEGSTDELYAW